MMQALCSKPLVAARAPAAVRPARRTATVCAAQKPNSSYVCIVPSLSPEANMYSEIAATRAGRGVAMQRMRREHPRCTCSSSHHWEWDVGCGVRHNHRRADGSFCSPRRAARDGWCMMRRG